MLISGQRTFKNQVSPGMILSWPVDISEAVIKHDCLNQYQQDKNVFYIEHLVAEQSGVTHMLNLEKKCISE